MKPYENVLGRSGVQMLYEMLATDCPFEADRFLARDGCKVFVLQLPEVKEIENTITTIEKLVTVED